MVYMVYVYIVYGSICMYIHDVMHDDVSRMLVLVYTNSAQPLVRRGFVALRSDLAWLCIRVHEYACIRYVLTCTFVCVRIT